MKKIIFFIFMLLCIPVMVNADDYKYVPMGIEDSFKAEGVSYDLGDYKTSPDKVNVYLFRGQGCPHCQHFLEFVSNTLVKEYGDYFNLISYETWKNDDNDALMVEVKKHFNYEGKGVPFIVIGDAFFAGYGEARNESIINLIKSEYEKTDREDLVSKIGYNGEKNPLEFTKTVDGSASDNNGNDNRNNANALTNDENDSIKPDLEIIIIGVVVIVAVAALVYVIMTYNKLKKKEVK